MQKQGGGHTQSQPNWWEVPNPCSQQENLSGAFPIIAGAAGASQDRGGEPSG